MLMFSALTEEFPYIYIPNNFVGHTEWRLSLRLTASKFEQEKKEKNNETDGS